MSTAIDQLTEPSEKVIQEVAEAKGVSATELSPLFDVVDPDALDALFHQRPAVEEGTGHVQFQYEGHTVIVHSSGRVGVSRTSG